GSLERRLRGERDYPTGRIPHHGDLHRNLVRPARAVELEGELVTTRAQPAHRGQGDYRLRIARCGHPRRSAREAANYRPESVTPQLDVQSELPRHSEQGDPRVLGSRDGVRCDLDAANLVDERRAHPPVA